MTQGSLTLDRMDKRFGGVHAVKSVSFDIRSGEVLGLVGENGAGKSTIVRMLAGAQQPDSGALLVDGRPLTLPSPRSATLAGISVIHQELHLVESQTIAENVFLGHLRPRLFGAIDWAELRRQARAGFERFGHAVDTETLVGEATAWERWATALVRATLHQSRVLILDEPTAAMDDAGAALVHRAIRQARDHGTAIVLVSHRLEEVEALSDRVVAMRNGAKVGEVKRAELNRARLVELITGRSARQPDARRASSAPGSPLLSVRSLSAGVSLRDVSFDVRAGEVLGIAGLVGSGRSRLLRLMVGAERRRAGQILMNGRAVEFHSPRDAQLAGVVMLAEDRLTQGLIGALPVAGNMTLGAPVARRARGLLVDLRGEREFAARRIRDLRIAGASADGSVLGLSGGNQQKVLFARSLAHQPRVLILDEPTRGVDVGARAELAELVREIAAAGGAVIVVLSDLEELADLVDRAVVLQDGRMAGSLEGETLTRERMLEVCYGSR